MGSMDLDQIVADAQKAFEQATDWHKKTPTLIA